MLELRLLGPVEVTVEGRPVPLRQKQRELLAVLALRAPDAVSTDVLIDELWGPTPPKTVEAALHNAVSQVRKAVGQDVLETRPPGYRLAVPPEALDVSCFERLLETSRDAPPGDRLRLLREALSLWRGRALSDVGVECLHAESARLEELRVAAREELIDAELEAGRHAAVLADIEALVAEHPFRERPWAQLMLARYRCGRQADALDAYRAARTFLRDELGLEPSAELRRLEAAILRQDPALDAPSAEALPERERRRTVTVLVLDVAAGEGLDPEVWADAADRALAGARTAVEAHGGTAHRLAGDELVAAFGAPEAHEDDALRAVRAALAAAEESTRAAGREDVTVTTRAGIATGAAVVSPGAFPTGDVVAVAKRLQRAAGDGELLVASATLALVRHAADAELVEVHVGGGARPLPAARVTAVRPAGDAVARRLRAPLVGRGAELDALLGAFARAAAGNPGLVSLVGEAGIGKTRLAVELVAHVRERARVAVGRCVSYGAGATFLPLAEIVRGLVPGGSHSELERLVGGEDAGLVARRVRELTGLAEGAPPPGEGEWALRRLLAAAARERPLLVVLEDVHWAEPTLLDAVEHLAGQLGSAPVLILCLARQELLDERPAWRRHATISLDPLGDDEAHGVLGNVAAAGVLDADVRRRIVAAAGGNPLYVEQLAAHLAEAGVEGLAATPPTLEALIAGRLDRLPADERTVAELTAVIGREASAAAVSALADWDPRRALAALAGRGLVRATADGYRFHHELIRDVAYAGVTKRRRSELHARHARWLDATTSAGDELIGYHLEQAHRYTAELRPRDAELPALAEEAGARLAAAGIKAWRRADGAAATNLLGRAAGLLPGGAARAATRCELGAALLGRGQPEAAGRAFADAAAEAEAAGDRVLALRSQLEAAHEAIFVGGGDVDAFFALAAHALPVIEEHGDERTVGRAWLLVSNAHAMRLQLDAWGEAAERAQRHYERAGWSPLAAMTSQAASLYYGPTPVPAALRRCRGLERAADGAVDRAGVLLFLGGLEALRARPADAERLVGESRTLYDEIGLAWPVASTWATVAADVARLRGDLDEAERVLEESHAALEALGNVAYLSTRSAELADLLVERGDLAAAGRAAAVAERHATPHDRLSDMLWRAARARVLAREGDLRSALRHARRAHALAEETDAVNYRAKIALDLAEVLRLAGRDEAARRHVRHAAELYRAKRNAVGQAAVSALVGRPARERRGAP